MTTPNYTKIKDFTDQEKLDFEVLKLQQEIRTLKRHPILQPAALLALIAFCGSVVINFKQYNDSVNKAKRQADSIYSQNRIAQGQFADIQKRVVRVQKDIENLPSVIASKSSSQLKQTLDNIFASVGIIGKIGNIATDQLKTPVSVATFKNDLATAKKQERDGFQYLSEYKFAEAKSAFDRSEKAYPGYHWSYELSRIQTAGLTTEQNKKAFLADIVKKYSGVIPDELKRDLNRAAGLPQ